MRKFCKFYFLVFLLHLLLIQFVYASLKNFTYLSVLTDEVRVNTCDDSTVNVHDFEIYGDSTTDYTTQIQQVLDNHKRVYFPPGKYLISKSLILHDGQSISGEKDSSVFLASETAGSTKNFAFMVVKGKKDIYISHINLILRHIPEYAVTAIRATNVAYLKIRKVNTINCGIVETWVERKHSYPKVPVSDATEIDHVSNFFIEIDSCNGIGATHGIAKKTTGVLLRYANHWKVTNSKLKGFYHGVQWWGGDSHPARDGDTVNIRKSKNGLVRNVLIDSIRGGGIWGSMGDNIRVEECRVSNCTDVGIDFEGCYNSRATNNYVENCKNGGLATFHYNKHIIFDNNEVLQNNAKRPLARIYNSSQRPDNGKIVFKNNTFIATNGIGFIDQHGPGRHIEFLNNTLHNVVLNLNFNNNNYILVEDNIINITQPILSYKYVIQAGQTHRNGVVEIKNNRITSTKKQDSSVYAISIYQSDYNSSPTNYLINNKVKGLPNQIKIEWAGANKGITTKTYIESEQPMLAPSVKKIDSGKQPSVVFINNKESH